MDIRFEEVSYTYQSGTPFEQRALFDLNLIFPDGKYSAVIGHTGSGKSTLLQHLNALVKPTSGKVSIGERVIEATTKNKQLKELRKKVGIVFQFPEAQLFEETILKDIAFGPKNFGASEEEAQVIARKMLTLVGLDESYADRSPFDLSGGQMRRVAIAGVLALEPEVLVLDEPTAGLDPKGREEMMAMFNRLHQEQGMTIILVTHLMEDVAQYADEVFVLEGGHLVKQGSPRTLFADEAWLTDKQLAMPMATQFFTELQAEGLKSKQLPLTPQELAHEIAQNWQEKGSPG